MARLPYGFDANPMYETRQPKSEAKAWERLDEVQLSLEKGEAVAPDLAAWVGEAIHHARQDPDELLRRLGLKSGRGKPAADPNAWFTVGKRICDLEDFGLNPDEVRAAHPLVSDPEALRPYGVNPDEVTPTAIGIIAYERMTPEEAIATVAAEFDEGGRGDEKFSRSQLQKFRDAYRAAWHVAHNPE